MILLHGTAVSKGKRKDIETHLLNVKYMLCSVPDINNSDHHQHSPDGRSGPCRLMSIDLEQIKYISVEALLIDCSISFKHFL